MLLNLLNHSKHYDTVIMSKKMKGFYVPENLDKICDSTSNICATQILVDLPFYETDMIINKKINNLLIKILCAWSKNTERKMIPLTF